MPKIDAVSYTVARQVPGTRSYFQACLFMWLVFSYTLQLRAVPETIPGMVDGRHFWNSPDSSPSCGSRKVFADVKSGLHSEAHCIVLFVPFRKSRVHRLRIWGIQLWSIWYWKPLLWICRWVNCPCKNVSSKKRARAPHELVPFQFVSFSIFITLNLLGVDTVDYNLYPDKPYQMNWLRTFLEFQFERDGKSAHDVRECDVERLYVQVQKFALVRNLCILQLGVQLSTLLSPRFQLFLNF